MPTAMHSSFDRGYDLGHAEVPTASHPITERRVIPRGRKAASWKKYIAFSMVAIMIASAFVIVAPMIELKAPDSTQSPQKGGITLGGSREVTWTYSHIGESYKKSTDYSQFGQSSSIDGINQWWYSRANTSGYNDLVVRATYPEITMNSAYGSAAGWKPVVAGMQAGYLLMSFYREDVLASNITTVATGFGKTPLFVPILNTTFGKNMDGGFLNWSYYCQYTTEKETDDIYNGTHFANTHFGVPAHVIDIRPTAGNFNDGYYFQVAGTVDFNASAARKFLGLAGKGDLSAEFTTANAGGALNTKWMDSWNIDGSSTGTMNTYTAYEYPMDAYPWWVYLTLDPSSTSTHLVVRLWSVAWGTDMLMNRYLDVAGIMSQQNTYEEDCYINGTAIPNFGRIEARMVESYHLSAWSDPNFYTAAWMLAPWHVDYDPTNTQNPVSSWNSRYNQYNGLKAQNGPRTYEYSPGTVAYGFPVLYWNPLNNWNLTAGEKIVIKLGNRPMLGVTPYRGASDVYLNSTGVANQIKINEIQSHFMWGELTMGNGFPAGSGLKQYYNGATKTLTITGPKNFPQNKNTLDARWTHLNLTASPNFIFDVSRVSNYSLAMVEPGPYVMGVTYNMTITAKNFTSATVIDWNGTVNLTAGVGVTLGASSMWFKPGSNGVLTATVKFSTNGSKTITATDKNNSLDVYNSLRVQVGSFNLNLVQGWNFVCVPLIGYGYKASNLGLATGDVVSSWNETARTYDHTYIKGISPSTKDFSINASTGYWIWVKVAKTLRLFGSAPLILQSRIATISGAGWVAIGLESQMTTLKARDVAQMYTGAGSITLISFYNATSHGYTTWLSRFPNSNNFAIVPGQAYWCWVTGSGTLSYWP